ncbi:DMT family transporter [Pusillimonas sp. CC-YST705]|uniref:DMT family transporter n=1 Tax=Mesopusillimonas faecipullorum TaxID=2755040 RepID=A0ABS8CDY7_9BURK|nr:DMT family transporter [Mesopusillimonas faecipullorum]
MTTRKNVDGLAFGLMAVLCLSWAFQQIALKVAAVDVSPVLQICLRSAIAAALVVATMAWRREPLNLADGSWRPGIVVGVLFAAEFLFLGEALRFTTASHVAVLIYSAPIFAAIGLHWRLPEERLTRLQWVGIALAFTGIAVAILGAKPRGPTPAAPNMLLGDVLALIGGLLWGATTVVIRCTRLAKTSATKTLLYQLIAAIIILAIAAGALGQLSFRSTPLAWGSVLFQGIVMSFGTLLAWFWMLRIYQASSLGVFSFMTPLFGIVLGAWLLDDPMDPSFLLGSALVVVGITLVSSRGWFNRKHA